MDNTVFLNTNREMPLLGLGVYKATGENEAENAIISAVESGYRLIDTASVYKNEENVGRGIASCGIPRNELFITTKVWNTAQRLGDIQGAFERSLDRLKLDYVDLYLIHWPVPGCYLSTWKVLEEIQESRYRHMPHLQEVHILIMMLCVYSEPNMPILPLRLACAGLPRREYQ